MSRSSRLSYSFGEVGARSVQLRRRGLAALAVATLWGAACTGGGGLSSLDGGSNKTESGGSWGSNLGRGSSGSNQPGSGGASGGGGSPGSNQPGSGGAPGNGGASGGGGGAPVVLNKGGVTLRLLTRDEYLASIQALLGTLKIQLTAPPDIAVAGFASVGAAQMSVTQMAETAYETASLAATAEVFGDPERWQTLVGCAPQADLSDACVTTFIESFGRRAFRRDLTDDEVAQWLALAKNGATLAGSAAQGLASMTSGLLLSPNFLYRAETNKLDTSNNRLKYDGLSMATRLSYTLTGGPPSTALLTAATSGQLNTPDGVRTAAAPLLASAGVVDRMTAFFTEYTQADQVLSVSKNSTLFPTFDAALKTSMLQSIQLFFKTVVLGPTAHVRNFYVSDQTFVDANLAPLYGVEAPPSGFTQVTLPSSSGRAGVLGHPAVLAGHSQADRTSPSRRGIFILETLLCSPVPPPPPGVDTTIPPFMNAPQTTRQQLQYAVREPQCGACHALFDPLGFALEHFDAIGAYRDEENGLPIDATGTLNGVPFDGEAEFSTVLRQQPGLLPCLLRNFYRYANGRAEDDKDLDQIDSLYKSLSGRGFVWMNFLTDFVASDAFRSAPALPVTTGSP